MSMRSELARFAAVGVLCNATLYLLYLALTASFLGHKTTLTVIYVFGSASGFVLNRNWTFRHGGALAVAGVRYWMVYIAGYLLNLTLLALLVDGAGLPHRGVQAALVVLIAALTFLLQKLWVFRPQEARASYRAP